MKTRPERLASFSSVFLRFALLLSFLSVVADRFGWWGAYGQPNVAWANFARFVAYMGKFTAEKGIALKSLAGALHAGEVRSTLSIQPEVEEEIPAEQRHRHCHAV